MLYLIIFFLCDWLSDLFPSDRQPGGGTWMTWGAGFLEPDLEERRRHKASLSLIL